MAINVVHVNSVGRAGLMIYTYESLSPGEAAKRSLSVLTGSILGGLFFEEMYELFVGTNKLSIISGCRC